MSWDTWRARKLSAENAARREAQAQAPTCPHCGALAEVSIMDVTTPSGIAFLHSVPEPYECSARCWQADPDGYLAAVT